MYRIGSTDRKSKIAMGVTINAIKDFFIKHPLINPKTFLGDAAFDSALLYKELLTGNTFGKDNHNSFIKCAQKLVSSVILISNYNVIN